MDSAEKSLYDRVAFYGKLAAMMRDKLKTPEVVLMAEMYEMVQERYPDKSINVFNETPDDMDGIVLKVTIS